VFPLLIPCQSALLELQVAQCLLLLPLPQLPKSPLVVVLEENKFVFLGPDQLECPPTTTSSPSLDKSLDKNGSTTSLTEKPSLWPLDYNQALLTLLPFKLSIWEFSHPPPPLPSQLLHLDPNKFPALESPDSLAVPSTLLVQRS